VTLGVALDDHMGVLTRGEFSIRERVEGNGDKID
jgi:hypothetical protein